MSINAERIQELEEQQVSKAEVLVALTMARASVKDIMRVHNGKEPADAESKRSYEMAKKVFEGQSEDFFLFSLITGIFMATAAKIADVTPEEMIVFSAAAETDVLEEELEVMTRGKAVN